MKIFQIFDLRGKSSYNEKLLIIISVILLINFVSAAGVSYCCEKTKTGSFCINTALENCDTSIDPQTKFSFRNTPTSCAATSFCKPGCCVDSQEGLCMQNTPQKVCETTNNATWVNDETCNVAQCQLGCCILGDQASLVTLTRCKKLSSFYGLQTNFKSTITNEVKCIEEAQSQDKGACVYESEGTKACKLVTRGECQDINAKAEFFKDYLCSADELATNCGPTEETMCVPGKDEVYFKDSCGNPANIYDSSKAKQASYWRKIIPKDQSCGSNSNNVDSRYCGNCDYTKGSMCRLGSSNYGDYACKDLNCKLSDGIRKNGESWCGYQGNVGNGKALVGSRHFRHICLNGEEVVEPCADYRNEICISDKIDTAEGLFEEAACRVNRWKDCIDQRSKEDCENKDQRECAWLPGYKLIFPTASASGASAPTASQQTQVFGGGNTGGFQGGSPTITGNAIADSTSNGLCVPNAPPGLKFWNKGDASSVCNLGTITCTVIFEKDILGNKECTQNCNCLTSAWAIDMNKICTSLGDCGAYLNINNKFTSGGAEYKTKGKKTLIQGLEQAVRQRAGA